MIVLVIGKVNGTSAHLHPRGESCFVDVMSVKALATKSRDEGGMNVEHAAFKIGGDGEQLQEAAETNQVRSCLSAGIEDALAELVRRGAGLALNQEGGDADVFRTKKA